MAKKRKLSSQSTTVAEQNKQQKQEQKKQEDEEEQQQHVEEDPVEEEEEEEEEEENDENDEDSEEDEEEDEETLLETFTKDQLISLLREASGSHPDVAARIKEVADVDTTYRKIFVHGLGWDTSSDTLFNSFSQYGQIEGCKAVVDRFTGKSKGYGFILFKSRAGARRALKEPQKMIGNRMTSCQLAAVGPVVPPSTSAAPAVVSSPTSSSQRKIYVSNVAAELDPGKLTAFFAKYGEIEEGPLGLDKLTGKFKGFCLFVYRSSESAKKALEEPHKHFERYVLHCQWAIDGPKHGKQPQIQPTSQNYGRNDNPNLAGAIGGAQPTGAGLMAYNQGAPALSALNPALGPVLTALLASQGAGYGLSNLLGALGGAQGAVGQGAYGNQAVGINPNFVGGYGTQAGLQSAYPSQQMMGQGGGGSGRSQYGHMGDVAPYSSH